MYSFNKVLLICGVFLTLAIGKSVQLEEKALIAAKVERARLASDESLASLRRELELTKLDTSLALERERTRQLEALNPD